MKEKKNWLGKVVLLIAVIAAVAVYFLVPGVNKMMNKVFAMFASGDFTVVRDFVASYGAYAAVISFLLMIFQSIAAPLPAFLLTFANANLFGWWQGAILSWTSAMAGAAACFYIARILGRDVAEKLTSKSGLAQIDTFFERYGKNTILICRLLPFISFDIVSYAAGLTSMSFMSFFIATGIGRWRHVDRRCKVIRDRAYDFVCPLSTDLYAEKNIYGQAVQKRKREDMKWILTTIRKIWRSLEPLGKKHRS